MFRSPLHRRKNLAAKVIVITGASSGIGRATALACYAAGMHVVLAARTSQTLTETAHDLDPTRTLIVPTDVTSESDTQYLIAKTLEKFGRLDAVFANAGYGKCAPTLDMPDADAHAMFDTNFHGTLRLFRAALPLMRQTPQGLRHLLACSSAASLIGLPLYGVYSATKAAQHAICDSIRIELEPENFKVTSIHPIGTRTKFFEVASSPKNPVGLNTPESMMQTPQHVAQKILRSLRRPAPQVWPAPATRFALAAATAFPSIGIAAMRRVTKRQNTT